MVIAVRAHCNPLDIYIYIYTCKLYKLINLCWSTGCFVKLHFTPIYIYIYIYNSDLFWNHMW